jgi:hypothetical protein
MKCLICGGCPAVVIVGANELLMGTISQIETQLQQKLQMLNIHFPCSKQKFCNLLFCNLPTCPLSRRFSGSVGDPEKENECEGLRCSPLLCGR